MPFGNETILHRFFDPLSNAPPDQALQAGKYTMLVHKGLLTNNSPVLSALTAIEPEIFLQDLAAERELPLIECSEFVHDPEAFLVVLRLTYGDVDAELMTALTTDLHLFRLVLATIESLKMGLTKRHLENLLTAPFYVNAGWRLSGGVSLKKVLDLIEFLHECHEHGLDTLTATCLEKNRDASLGQIDRPPGPLAPQDRAELHNILGRISKKPGNPATDLLMNLMFRSLGLGGTAGDGHAGRAKETEAQAKGEDGATASVPQLKSKSAAAVAEAPAGVANGKM